MWRLVDERQIMPLVYPLPLIELAAIYYLKTEHVWLALLLSLHYLFLSRALLLFMLGDRFTAALKERARREAQRQGTECRE
jgi:hypothetical protein